MKNSKGSRKFKLIMVAGMLVALIGTTAYAASNQPGGVSDPIVTKSYVDEQVRLMKESLKTQLKQEVMDELKSQIGTGSSDRSFEAFQLQPGQTLIGYSGTEIIVRSGTVKVKAGDNGDGIPDVTGGKDLAGDELVPANHLLIIPRTDNRGITVDANSKTTWVMVRGPYEVR